MDNLKSQNEAFFINLLSEHLSSSSLYCYIEILYNTFATMELAKTVGRGLLAVSTKISPDYGPPTLRSYLA